MSELKGQSDYCNIDYDVPYYVIPYILINTFKYALRHLSCSKMFNLSIYKEISTHFVRLM